MAVIIDIQSQLDRDEGRKKLPYVDTVGKTTIGVGRNLTRDGISDQEMNLMRDNDIEAARSILNARLPYFQALDSVRQGVLINMAFNMGFRGLEGFQNMLRAFAQHDWEIAAREMVSSKWASEVGDRATRLERQVILGTWQ